MRTGRAVVVVGLMCCGFSFLSFNAAFMPAAPGPDPRPPAIPVLANDSIRTDLSDYAWPTDAGDILTSTFAEFRALHFHGGIDVSTGDRTGYHVYASRDGYVSKIHIGPNGYGKMLFVRHPDGYYTTYAHLSRFAPAEEARAVREQQRLGRYSIDLDLAADEIPVRKGELIAYTGDTGIGTAHLHFEIRDENLDVVNPQLAPHLRAPDGIPPVISKVAITPLDDHSYVHGGWEAQVYQAHADGSNHYHISETVNITGRAGFAISVRDRTEGTRFQRGVYSNTLFIDDRQVYFVRIDRAPMKNAHEIGLYYDWNLLDAGRGRFERLYAAETPDVLPFGYPRTPDAGVVNSTQFAEGRHSFRIVSEDIAGNRAEITGALVFNHPPEFTVESPGPEIALRFPSLSSIADVVVSTNHPGTSSWSSETIIPQREPEGNLVKIPLPTGSYDVIKVVAENTWGTKSRPRLVFVRKPTWGRKAFTLEHSVNGDYVRVVARTSAMFTTPPHVVVYEGNSLQSVAMDAADADTYVGSFRPSENFAGLRRLTAEAEVNGETVKATDELEVYPIVPGKSGSFQIDGGKLLVSYDSLSVFNTLYMQVDRTTDDGETSYALLPAHAVLRGSLKVSMLGNPGIKQQQLYFRGRSSRDILATRPTGPGSLFEGRISRTFGDLFFAVDDVPPYANRIAISARSSRRPSISCRVGDNFSGIEYDELRMYIDGKVVIPEIDGEHHRVFYQGSDPLERGSHLLTIRLKDRSGNSNTVERRFSVR